MNSLARTTPSRRYPLVLVPPPGESAPGREVLAPADGRVARTAGDGAPPGELGAFVALEVAAGEFLFLTNLEPGSVAVRAGDEVWVGQALGRIGESAVSIFTPTPHLGMHLQDTPEPFWGQGIPWFLHGVEIDGRAVEKGMPRGGGRRDGEWTGQRVRPSNTR